MEHNQSGTAPPGGRSYAIPLSALFLVLAVILGLLPDHPAPRGESTKVDAAFFDKAPMRKLGSELLTADDHEKCKECHEPGESLDDVKPGELGHHERKLQHGRNDKCFHCHNPKDMATFQNHDGDPVVFKDVVEMCTNCHGPQYRDWKAGIHGRRNGYFDRKRGEQTNLTCIECHDPHYPVFKPIKPAPGPHAPHGRVAGSSIEHPGGKPVQSLKSSSTPSASPSRSPEASPSKSPDTSPSKTPEATPSASPSGQK